jgi:hypothetical protein
MLRPFFVSALLLALASTHAFAQDDDAVIRLEEPDYTLVSLPTSLRLPRFGGTFRVTHRFVRPLSCDTCPNNLIEDFFGIDNGAQIGLEYRFGIVPNGQIGFHRAQARKTIELFGLYGLTRQNESVPVETAARIAVEGTDNFRDEFSPTAALIVTRLFGDRGAVHVEPIWVGHSNIDFVGGDDNTLMIGLGGRLRIRPTVYVTGEFVPRVAGFKPGTHHGSIAIEKRAGGHMFQLNFSTSLASTFGQMARGGFDADTWFMGFNISRKFY